MKQRMQIPCALAIAVALTPLSSCSSPKDLVFANRVWHISDHYGHIIDTDTTYRMSFGNVLIPEALTIISSNDSVAKYPGMDSFIAEILHTARLDSAEILFYAPHMATMFVLPKGNMSPARPSSVSSPMYDEKPYTMWVYEDDFEDWTREATEMYTYTYFNKRKKQILTVDFYDYGDKPLAQISVFQSNTKATDKMNIPHACHHAFLKHDLGKYEHEVEFWANIIDGHRQLAFANYKIDQEQAQRMFDANRIIAQADSAMMTGDPDCALKFFKKYLRYEKHPDKSVLYNAACAASLSGETDFGLNLLKTIFQQDTSWYLKEPLDNDLTNLQESDEWESFYSLITERKAKYERDYDMPLRMRLTRIRRDDQNVRHRFLSAYLSQPQDSLLVRNLAEEMRVTDAKNLHEVDSILNEYGWPGREKVGDECATIWLVLQHSDIEAQNKALPLLKTAAANGDISPAAIAMLEDRILVNSGRKQIYGSQFYYADNDGEKYRVIYPIDDIENIDARRMSVGLNPFNEEYSSKEISMTKQDPE